ncbi:MAG TPA: hypothetical protein VHC01_04355 [Gaiellaceae bacterium]|jgi:hypothetical protein|nr:hypothetical protein [Gaiellaceae bacterium]
MSDQPVRRDVLEGFAGSASVPKLDPVQQLHGQTLRLRGVYASTFLGALAAQMIVADLAFFLYAGWGVRWHLPPVVITAWLSATVVEIVGVVYAVTRSLFPLNDGISPARF